MLDQVPSALVSGDTWAWTLSIPGYEAPTWTASVYFQNSAAAFSATASASGSDHAFSVSAATTTTYAAGRYRWTVRVTDGSAVTTIESGWVDVARNPAAAGTHDHRSWARRTLEAVEAFLEGNASTAQQAMTIQGRSLTRWSIAELTKWRDRLKSEVTGEEASTNAGKGRTIKLRFKRA